MSNSPWGFSRKSQGRGRGLALPAPVWSSGPAPNRARGPTGPIASPWGWKPTRSTFRCSTRPSISSDIESVDTVYSGTKVYSIAIQLKKLFYRTSNVNDQKNGQSVLLLNLNDFKCMKTLMGPQRIVSTETRFSFAKNRYNAPVAAFAKATKQFRLEKLIADDNKLHTDAMIKAFCGRYGFKKSIVARQFKPHAVAKKTIATEYLGASDDPSKTRGQALYAAIYDRREVYFPELGYDASFPEAKITDVDLGADKRRPRILIIKIIASQPGKDPEEIDLRVRVKSDPATGEPTLGRVIYNGPEGTGSIQKSFDARTQHTDAHIKQTITRLNQAKGFTREEKKMDTAFREAVHVAHLMLTETSVGERIVNQSIQAQDFIIPIQSWLNLFTEEEGTFNSLVELDKLVASAKKTKRSMANFAWANLRRPDNSRSRNSERMKQFRIKYKLTDDVAFFRAFVLLNFYFIDKIVFDVDRLIVAMIAIKTKQTATTMTHTLGKMMDVRTTVIEHTTVDVKISRGEYMTQVNKETALKDAMLKRKKLNYRRKKNLVKTKNVIHDDLVMPTRIKMSDDYIAKGLFSPKTLLFAVMRDSMAITESNFLAGQLDDVDTKAIMPFRLTPSIDTITTLVKDIDELRFDNISQYVRDWSDLTDVSEYMDELKDAQRIRERLRIMQAIHTFVPFHFSLIKHMAENSLSTDMFFKHF